MSIEPGVRPGRGDIAQADPTAVLTSAQVTIRRWAERDHNVVRWTEVRRGAHILATEEPDLLVAPVRGFLPKAG